MVTSLWAVKLRSITRRLGLNKLVGTLLVGHGYEDRFGPALKSEARPGETVWDVGANVGLYTQEFAKAVGKAGRVLACEPIPACYETLRERFAGIPQVSLMNVAVGAADGHICMSLDANPLAATHRVVQPDGSGGGRVQVEVRSAESIVVEYPELFPNLVKIDVEGHEGAVLDGMHGLLADRRLRCVGIEVHFGLLDARGENERPKQIEQTLIGHGFQVRWTDPSHLLALR